MYDVVLHEVHGRIIMSIISLKAGNGSRSSLELLVPTTVVIDSHNFPSNDPNACFPPTDNKKSHS